MTTRILIGDVREQLKTLADESVHCVVTSPPYWGLRDYGTAQWEGGDPSCDHAPDKRGSRFATPVSSKQASNAGSGSASRRDCPCGASRIDSQLGMEATYQEHVDAMVDVFREVKRVLRKDGTLWLNYGDSYAAGASSKGAADNANHDGGVWADGQHKDAFRNSSKYQGQGRQSTVGGILKPKDLCGIPWRVAFALQADGWYLRQDIIWAKPNPMPESVKDRCTKAHEYIFLLTKSPRYYFDAEAIKEPWSAAGIQRQQYGYKNKWGHTIEANSHSDSREFEDAKSYAADDFSPETGRNKRSVWEIATSPFPEAHFATFPPELPEICIKAGTSEKGCCGKCGKPWVRVTERTIGDDLDWQQASGATNKHAGRIEQKLVSTKSGLNKGDKADYYANAPRERTLRWEPSCKCNEMICENGCTVLDIEHGHKSVQNDKPQQIGRFADVSAVRDGVSRTERIEQVVLAGLSGAMGRQKPKIHNGQDDHEQGLCDASSPQSSDGGVIRVCDGAPISDGSASREIPETDRSGSPQERQSAGQQDREPRGDDEARSRQRQKANVSRSVPALSQGVPSAGQCPRCGGRLVERPFKTLPSVVLDCFGGAGTTGLVADRLQRNCILIELNPEYAAIAKRRIYGDAPMFAEVSS